MSAPRTGVTLSQFLVTEEYGEKDELVLGEVWGVHGQGFDHLFCTLRIEEAMKARFPDRWVTRYPFLAIADEGRPRPDVAVFREPFAAYLARGDFDASDAEIVVEVTVSTHPRVTGPKDRQYARGGVPEYVIVDLKNRYVEVRTEPTPEGYLRRVPLGESGSYRGVPVTDLLDSVPEL